MEISFSKEGIYYSFSEIVKIIEEDGISLLGKRENKDSITLVFKNSKDALFCIRGGSHSSGYIPIDHEVKHSSPKMEG